MSLKIYNISKGELEEEKVCAEKLMRFLYGGKMGEAALWLLISRGIFSKATIEFALTTLASPHKFSDKTGFFLWGIAEDPFWCSPKPSSTSRTSVLCRCLISVANCSITLAIKAKDCIKYAW